MEYSEFLLDKKDKYKFISYGNKIRSEDINNILFPFQKDIVRWAVFKGACAIFLDTGLGKTFIQLEWARLISKKCLIIAPLSVAKQTIREAQKIGIEVNYCHDDNNLQDGINITNYELIENFKSIDIDAIILDESSILKSINGKIRQKLFDKFKNVKYRLCCTATPAPNDYIELGNHAQFLNVCTRQEMLSMFFINANKEHTYIIDNNIYTEKGSNKGGIEWRLKHHAEDSFFEWLSAWSLFMMKPSDLNYEDKDYILPPLQVEPIFLNIQNYKPSGKLFFDGLSGIQDRVEIRKSLIQIRKEKLKELIKLSNEQWIIWCGLDDESKEVRNLFNGNCREVKGADNIEYKINAFEDFQNKKYQILITKPKIAAFGMNFQNANNMVFFGMNDSWETYYQAIRRIWRFGQKKPVNVYLLLSNLEREIYDNIMRKENQAIRLRQGMIKKIKKYEMGEIMNKQIEKKDYKETTIKGENYLLMAGDSCQRLQEIESDSIDLSIYSPPFMDLFTYSNSERDLGNCTSKEDFLKHYSFIVREILRVTKEGRLSCVHVSDIPAMANRDGYIGLKDFPGDVIRLHQDNGWTFVGRAFVQKNPQAQAIRVKSKALLFIQLRKDSSCSRPALIDQILIFKKEGENKIPIEPVKNGEIDNETWIKWAHGIWTDIQETNTLQYYEGRDKDDEKHICPLQLETIERCIKLYSNHGETILTPFMGIGSEIFVANKLSRKGIGIELKESYFKLAVKNIKSVNQQKNILLNDIGGLKISRE